MKILHAISQAPDFTGSGKYIQAVLKQASTKGHENFLVAGVQGDFVLGSEILAKENTLFVRFNTQSLDFPLPGMSDAMPYESTVFSTMSTDQVCRYETAFRDAISRAVDRFRPDIIHSHHLWIMSAVACGVAPEIPMVTTCHGTCLRQFTLCAALGIRANQACRKINRVMALSRHQKAEINRIHEVAEDRIDIVGGGYDERLFYVREKPSPPPVEIVYAGKLSRAKGVPWLLETMHQVTGPDWRLHLAGGGSGEEKDNCLALAKEFGKRIVVHGPLSHPDLAALMRRSHLFVLPSFYEGLPLVLMEAIACGCRVIATSLPGTREILGDSDSSMACIIELPELETIDRPYSRDEAGLRASLAAAVNSMLVRISDQPQPDRQSVGRLVETYTWESVFSRIESVYKKALSQN